MQYFNSTNIRKVSLEDPLPSLIADRSKAVYKGNALNTKVSSGNFVAQSVKVGLLNRVKKASEHFPQDKSAIQDSMRRPLSDAYAKLR